METLTQPVHSVDDGGAAAHPHHLVVLGMEHNQLVNHTTSWLTLTQPTYSSRFSLAQDKVTNMLSHRRKNIKMLQANVL